MTRKIINYGSINIDHVYQVDHFVSAGETLSSESLKTGLGGKGANQSVAMAKAGADVVHVGQLGVTDGWAKEKLSGLGVQTSYIKSVSQPSGHAIIQLDRKGENSIIVHGGANQSCSLTELENCLTRHKDIAYFVVQNECNGVLDAIKLADSLGIDVVFNPAPMSKNVLELPLDRLAILIVNEVEALQFWGTDDLSEIQSLLECDFPDTNVIVTQGAKGSSLLNSDGIHQVSAFSVNVRDTTAAGDTYVGFLMAGLVNDLSIKSAMKQASIAAAITASRVGAIDAIPNLKEVQELANG